MGNVKLKHAIIVGVLSPAVLVPRDSPSKAGANPLTDFGGRKCWGKADRASPLLLISFGLG